MPYVDELGLYLSIFSLRIRPQPSVMISSVNGSSGSEAWAETMSGMIVTASVDRRSAGTESESRICGLDPHLSSSALLKLYYLQGAYFAMACSGFCDRSLKPKCMSSGVET